MKDQLSKLNNFYTNKCAIKLIKASSTTTGLVCKFAAVTSSHENTYVFPWLWVRDHCIDASSLDQNTTQRTVDTFALSSDLKCTSINVNLPEQMIDFFWSDQSSSCISWYVLASSVGLTPSQHELVPASPRKLWCKESPLSDAPSVQFNDVMQNDTGLLLWLQNIHIYGLCLVEGVPTSEQGTRELALRLGPIQETIFGGLWPLSSELKEHGDSAYGESYLEPHTDGTYYHDAPGLQMFNCIDMDCKGGDSIQLDGFAMAEKIRNEDPQAFETLCEVMVPGHYIEPGAHLRAQRPAIKLDADGNLLQVSFNNYDRAPMLLEKEQQARFYHAYGLLHKHVIDQDNWLKIRLRRGTTLIFDNWRNMHGRMAFSGRRYFYGCYHSRAVFESKLRVLQSESALL